MPRSPAPDLTYYCPLSSVLSGINGLHFCVPNSTESCGLPSRGRQRITVFMPFSGPLHGELPLDCATIPVYGESSWESPTGLADHNWVPHSNAWKLCWFRYPRSSCNPGDPKTALSYLGLCPTSPSEHSSDKVISQWHIILKVLILHTGAISLSGRFLLEPPSPHGLISDISPQIQFSALPNLQKVVAFLFGEFQ